MKIKLYRDIKDLGEAGDVVDVEGSVGNRLLCNGQCQVLEHDPPPPDMPVGVVTEPPQPPPKPSPILDSTGAPADGKEAQEADNDEAE